MNAGRVVGVVLALVVGAFVGFAVHNSLSPTKTESTLLVAPGPAAVKSVELSYNGGTCKQNLAQQSPATAPVQLNAGDTVSWSSDDGVVQINFPQNDSPFYKTSSGSSVSSGQAYPRPNDNSTNGSQYAYESVSIGNNPCTNPGQLGMIIKP